ncbi:methyltransferase domain-containing protein [Actinoplanes sp. NPDC049802]|uniref:methyltransferase domain-containing protein n=1 Tax=Actinoplanes sp. NPDC049802 TaxID=3154742 RepID=UPI0033EFFDC0
MTTTDYLLGRSAAEYERLRAQARVWERASADLLDRAGVRPGGRCLDVGCGPGETMRLMAERVGPDGRVTGIDRDTGVGAAAVGMLRGAGHSQCSFLAGDVEDGDLTPGRYDLVFARLLLLHMTDPVAVLRRLWEWTAPGGHLVVQDYDLTAVAVEPELAVVEEWRRVFLGTFTATGKDVRLGRRLPGLFAAAGVGEPDGIEVAGRMEPMRAAGGMLAATYRSVAPAAVSLGLVTEPERDVWLGELERSMTENGGHTAVWPLMIGVHRQRTDR